MEQQTSQELLLGVEIDAIILENTLAFFTKSKYLQVTFSISSAP